MVWKKVANSDVGDADHFGGDDLDKVSDLFSGTDVDDIDINSDFSFRSQKLKYRNPTNTFSITQVNPAVTADKDRRSYGPFSYLIEKEGSGASTYYVKNMSKDCIDQSGVTANTAIQYAIDTLVTGFDGDATRRKGTVFIRNNEFYTGLDLTLKSGVWLVGEGYGTILTGKITVQDTSDTCGMKNIWLTNTAADHCLYVNGARWFTAEDCQFYLNNTTLTKYPVLIDGGTDYSTSNVFNRCKIVSKGHGLKQQASATSKYSNTTTLRDCYVVFIGTPLPGTGGEVGINVDGDAVEKNFYAENCYVESWDTGISLDNGWCHLENMWLDTCTTAGISVTQAALNTGSQYINAVTANITTQPLLVLGGRKYYATSGNYSMVYDNRKVLPNTAWVEKYLFPAHNAAQPYGAFYGHNSGDAGEGLFSQVAISGTTVNAGDYANGRWVRYTSAGASGDNCGFRYTGVPFLRTRLESFIFHEDEG